MAGWKRLILAVQSILVLGMVVLDPTEAHRPPEQREIAQIGAIHEVAGQA